MRGLIGGVWLAAVLLLDVAHGNGNMVNFDGGFNDGASIVAGNSSARRSIFIVNPTDPPKKFTWSAKVRIRQIGLYVLPNTDKDPTLLAKQTHFKITAIPSGPSTPTSPESNQPSSSTSSAEPAQSTPQDSQQDSPAKLKLVRRDPVVLDVDVNLSGLNGMVLVKNLHALDAQHKGMPLYFEAIWLASDGRSYSPAFAAILEGESRAAARQMEPLNSFEPFRPEQPPRGTGTDSNNNSNGGDGVMPDVPPTTATSTGTDSPSAFASGSGLPVGAIAGIAAGCGFLGLLLIGFLVWYYLRKRQQKRASLALHPGGYHPPSRRTRTDELMAEKEATLAHTDPLGPIPHSPYSDADIAVLENQGATATAAAAAAPAGANAYAHRDSTGSATNPLIPLVPVGMAVSTPPRAAAAGDGPPGYTPYTDRPGAEGAGAAPPAAVEGTPGRSTPHGVSTQYAHLVEEGMTAEEIQRLEEEERALDAAIERAVRRPTG